MISLLCNYPTKAQQEAQFSNFVANAVFYNPAVVGERLFRVEIWLPKSMDRH